MKSPTNRIHLIKHSKNPGEQHVRSLNNQELFNNSEMNILLFSCLSFTVILSILCNNDFYVNQLTKVKKNNDVTERNLRNLIKCNMWFREIDNQIRMKRASEDHDLEEATQPRLVEMKNISEFSNSSGIDKHSLLVANFKRLWPVGRWREYGIFSEDYLDLINEHWLRFPPPSESLQKFLGGLYLVFSTVGCWGNITVLFMYFK